MYRVEYSRFADADITEAAQWFIDQDAHHAMEQFFKTIAAKEQHVLVLACLHTSRSPSWIDHVLTAR